MILNQKESTIAYRCPHCGSGILAMVGVFSLSGDMIKLKCDCGHSELVIKKTRDKKLRLTVPCMLCPKPHTFVVSQNSFFDDELFTIPCSMTGLDVCFIGRKDDVTAALDRQEQDIIALLHEAGCGDDIHSLAEMHLSGGDDDDSEDAPDRNGENYTDNHIYDMVLFVLRELEAENHIHCRCTERGGHGDYDIVCDRDDIYIVCKTCGARCEIGCTSSMATEAFLDTDDLILEGMSADFSDDDGDSDAETDPGRTET